MSETMTTVESGQPWCVWHYRRSDRVAMILGGLVIGQCAVCGQTERLGLGLRGIWFPPKDKNYRHPKRDEFLLRHWHPEAEFYPQKWVLPLLNPEATKQAWRKYESLGKGLLGHE